MRIKLRTVELPADTRLTFDQQLELGLGSQIRTAGGVVESRFTVPQGAQWLFPMGSEEDLVLKLHEMGIAGRIVNLGTVTI